MKILAFESSCDETSVAVVEDGKKILSNIISTQIDIHKEFGGVVPEIASRHHIENILPVFTEALEKASCKLSDIDYIAVTNTPGLIGSLLVGLMFAKSLSYANNIPLIPVNHINGHIFSSFIDNDVKLPAISLVVSGGHTNLYYIYEENGKIITDLLGETLDDAVGETYDKIARILGLEYPGGPHIDRLSVNGEDILKIIVENIYEDASVIVTTHLIDDIEHIFDEFVFMQNGAVSEIYNAEKIRNEENITITEFYKKIYRNGGNLNV